MKTIISGNLTRKLPQAWFRVG